MLNSIASRANFHFASRMPSFSSDALFKTLGSVNLRVCGASYQTTIVSILWIADLSTLSTIRTPHVINIYF